jgi:hypothetical protein
MSMSIQLRFATMLVALFAAGFAIAAPAREVPVVKVTLELGPTGTPLTAKVSVTNRNADAICLPHNYQARTRLNAIRNGARLERHNSIEGRPTPGCTPLPSRQTLSFTHDVAVMYPGDTLANTTICLTLHWQADVSERSPVRLKTACVKSPRVR